MKTDIPLFRVRLSLFLRRFASAASLKSGIPKPTLRVVRVVQNGSVTFSIISALMPKPLSVISNISSFSVSTTEMIISVASAFTEFFAMSSILRDISFKKFTPSGKPAQQCTACSGSRLGFFKHYKIIRFVYIPKVMGVGRNNVL